MGCLGRLFRPFSLGVSNTDTLIISINNKETIFKMLSYRLPFQSSKILSSVRFCHNEKNELARQSSLQRSQEDSRLATRSPGGLVVPYWSETAAIRKQKRDNKFPRTVTNITDFLRGLQSLRNFPMYLSDLPYFIKKRRERAELIEQAYLPKRVNILRSDMAAAHFLVRRGGSIKFVGQQDWIGKKEKKRMLPMMYTPGWFLESIKAEGTHLYYEGLPNLAKLKSLKYLSLKNLKTMNDWCMDWISKEYCMSLKHLDISGCVNITHRGLSCFYRFECLETLNVEGIPDTAELKLACLMLLEIMPYLDIQGINLSIPEKIGVGEIKQISDSNKEVQELKT